MKSEKFDRLLKRLEKVAQNNPDRYKKRVRLLAIVGYCYIFALLGGLIVIALYSLPQLYKDPFLILFVFGIPWFLLFGSLLSALFIKTSPPDGKELSRQEAPELFSCIDELANTIQAPKPDRVLLTHDFNAAIAQIPRYGILGGYRNYLIIGLPLLLSFSLTHFRAVLAHEFGHLSSNHSRFRGWIYRVRQTWVQTLEQIGKTEKSLASIPVIDFRFYIWVLFWRGLSWLVSRLFLHSFFYWYVPRFNAHAFVLGRGDEYQADALAAQLVGPQGMAQTLLRMEIYTRFSQHFWKGFWKQANDQPEPTLHPATEWSQALKKPLDADLAAKFTKEALAVKTDNLDTHPCLRDRLKALGYEPPLSFSGTDSIQASAAELLLPNLLPELMITFDRQWHAAHYPIWEARFQHAQQIKQSLEELESKSALEPLTLEEGWQRAQWTADVIGEEEAIPLLLEILQQQENHGLANYLLGQILLERDDRSGIQHIENSMQTEPDALIHGSELILNFLKRQGEHQAVEEYAQKAQNYYKTWVMAQQERAGATKRDRFQPHQLTEEQVNQLVESLRQYPPIKEAFLVQKVVKHFPEKCFYILGINRQRSFWETDPEFLDKELVSQIAATLQFPHTIWITILNTGKSDLKRILPRISPPLYSRRQP